MPAPIIPTTHPTAPAARMTSARSLAVAGHGDRVMVLTDTHVAELLTARDAVRRVSLPLLAVGRRDFPLPTLGAELARLADELEGDHGHVVLRGLPVDRLSDADQRLVLWGIGRHVGIAVSQDSFGRLIRSADTSRTDFHSGGSDITALLVRDEGRGVSLAHTGRVVDEVAMSRPDLALRLFDAFHHDRMDGQEPGEQPYRSAPLACRHDDRLSVRYDRLAIESAQRFSGVPRLTPADRALLDLLDEVAAAPAWRGDVRLERGDLLLLNNYEVLHRHVGSAGEPALEPLRLWITLRAGRSLPDAFTWPTPAYGETGGRGGVAPRDVVDPAHLRTPRRGLRR